MSSRRRSSLPVIRIDDYADNEWSTETAVPALPPSDGKLFVNAKLHDPMLDAGLRTLEQECLRLNDECRELETRLSTLQVWPTVILLSSP
jgi:hypothetical protein